MPLRRAHARRTGRVITATPASFTRPAPADPQAYLLPPSASQPRIGQVEITAAAAPPAASVVLAIPAAAAVLRCTARRRMAAGAEAPANGRSDAAATPPATKPRSHRFIHRVNRSLASKTTIARPLSSRCAPCHTLICGHGAVIIAGDQCGLAEQIGCQVIEPRHVQPNIAQSGDKVVLGSSVHCGIASRGGCAALPWARPTTPAVARAPWAAMVLGEWCIDPGRFSPRAATAQRMVGQSMSAAAAADMLGIPFQRLHRADTCCRGGDVAFDPGSV